MIEIIMVTLAAFVIDALWAIYIRHVAKGSVLLASSVGSVIYIFGALATIAYISNPWMLIPATVGGFLVYTYYNQMGHKA
jgi:hypothetical protein